MFIDKRILLAAVTALVLTGCVNTGKHLEDGYQFGDGLATAYEAAKDLIVMRQAYCVAKDPEVKDAILRAIHLLYPNYPEEGVCTGLDNILDAIEEEQAGDALIVVEPAPDSVTVREDGVGKSIPDPVDPNTGLEPTTTSGS